MYEVFYNLSAEPFRLSPDHTFRFEHESYSKAYAYMTYAFRRAEGFVMITGKPGTGKTTLIGDLVDDLSRERVNVAYLVCTQLQADDLLRSVAYSFGIESTGLAKAELIQRLTQLLNKWQKENRRALLAVDEAQDLSSAAMEELRLLTNIQQSGQPLLQVFLLGQPELRDLILADEMEQVHQRILAASHIEGLQEEETESYVMHRLQSVNWIGDPAIDRAIFPLIYKFSEGIPRRINLICSRLFLLGSVEKRHSIRVEDVEVVIRELQGEGLAAGRRFSPLDFKKSANTDWVEVPVESTPAAHEPDPLNVVSDEPAAVASHGVDESKKENRDPGRLGMQRYEDLEEANEEPEVAVGLARAVSKDEVAEFPPPNTETEKDAVVGDDATPVTESSGSDNGDDRAPAAATGSDEPLQEVERRNPEQDDRSSLARRISSLGIPVILVMALLFLARDLVSPDLASRLAATAGLEEFAWLISSGVERDQVANIPGRESAIEDSLPGSGLSLESGPEATVYEPELDPAQVSATGEPRPDFSVQFQGDSDVLDYDAWIALDRAAAVLREQAEVYVLIAYQPDQPLDTVNVRELAKVRIATVKQYLVTGGVDPSRLRVENAVALGLDPTGQEITEAAGEVIRILIGSGAVE